MRVREGTCWHVGKGARGGAKDTRRDTRGSVARWLGGSVDQNTSEY
jgi:hypothetical protein